MTISCFQLRFYKISANDAGSAIVKIDGQNDTNGVSFCKKCVILQRLPVASVLVFQRRENVLSHPSG